MSQIKNIIFDFGNVLFDLDLPAIERHMRQHFGSDFPEVMKKLRYNKVFELYETGGITTEEFIDNIRFAADPALSAQLVQDVWNSIFIGMPAHRFEMLLELRQRYKVFLLSNINAMHEAWIADYVLREHGIEDYESRYFDGVYFSHLIRLRKPNADIYEYVLADAEILPAESIFFDDVQENVAAARLMGIHGHLHPVGTEIQEHVNRVLASASPKKRY